MHVPIHIPAADHLAINGNPAGVPRNGCPVSRQSVRSAGQPARYYSSATIRLLSARIAVSSTTMPLASLVAGDTSSLSGLLKGRGRRRGETVNSRIDVVCVCCSATAGRFDIGTWWRRPMHHVGSMSGMRAVYCNKKLVSILAVTLLVSIGSPPPLSAYYRFCNEIVSCTTPASGTSKCTVIPFEQMLFMTSLCSPHSNYLI